MAAVPEPKSCATCGRRVEWPETWARDGESVRSCDERGRRSEPGSTDLRLVSAGQVEIIRLRRVEQL